MAQVQDTTQCVGCKKRFFDDGFRTTRLGARLKTCLECNARAKVKRAVRKCPHAKQKWDCRACVPNAYCEHGKRKLRHTCAVCDVAGNTKHVADNALRLRARHAREFASGWPYGHVQTSPQRFYNTIVDMWKATFAKMLADGEIDEPYHAQILANLKPWDAEGSARSEQRRIEERREARRFATEQRERERLAAAQAPPVLAAVAVPPVLPSPTATVRPVAPRATAQEIDTEVEQLLAQWRADDERAEREKKLNFAPPPGVNVEEAARSTGRRRSCEHSFCGGECSR